MASKSNLSYAARADLHPDVHPVVKRLFTIAEAKKSNLVISADVRTTADLLELADQLGPYIAVFKTHIDLISDFSVKTVSGLKDLSEKHNFLIFEDRKFIDIGHTVQQQYHGGALKISEFAHIVNASNLGGEGIIHALDEVITSPMFEYKDQRAVLILAQMTTTGSLADVAYTKKCVDIAQSNKGVVIGFVATRQLENFNDEEDEHEDFVIFTTGVNMSERGDRLGQTYQTPSEAIHGGSDFVIAGRGIYQAADPVEAAKAYQAQAWGAYLERINL